MCKLLQFRAFPPSSCDCLMSSVTWPLTGVETTFLNGKVICNITIFDMGYSIFAARNDHWKMWVCLQQVTSRSNGLSLFSMFKNMPWLGGMPHCQTIQISYQIDYMICIYIYICTVSLFVSFPHIMTRDLFPTVLRRNWRVAERGPLGLLDRLGRLGSLSQRWRRVRGNSDKVRGSPIARWGFPKMGSIKWMIYGYLYFRKPPDDLQ